MKEILCKIYKLYAFYVITDVFKYMSDLLNLNSFSTDFFRWFELRFSAQFDKFNAHGNSTQIPESMTEFMLHLNDQVDATQRITIIAPDAT